MQQPERFVIETPAGTLVYSVAGPADGQPVILMHGWGCTRQTLASVESLLNATHRVYNVDFPGFGDSPEPPTVWGVDDYARLIEALIEREHIKSPVLLGHSFGGRVAIVLGARHSDISKIILVDAAGIKPKRPLSYYFKIYSYKLSRRISRLIYGEERAREMAEKAMRRRASADYLAASPRMRAILSRVVNEDLRSLLPSIKASTLLIWGANDTATPLADAKLMERLIPDAGLVSFEGCGHYSFLDNPLGFAAVVRSFLGINHSTTHQHQQS